MGVVRREGDWRLEKREEGVYEITHQKQPQEVILTPDYTPDMMDTYGTSGMPTHRVDTYEEAKGLFEERAHGSQSSPISPVGSQSSSGPGLIDLDSNMAAVESDLGSISDGSDGFENAEDVPPGGMAIAMIGIAVIFLWTSDFEVGSTVFGIGALFLVGGLGIVGWAVLVTEDLTKAVAYLATNQESGSSDSRSNEKPERTPPAPQKLKDDLYFDRADQECEWCGEDIDQLEVHHIEPRSEGGPNKPKNLIVLCPNCHSKADSGAISRSKLKAKVRRTRDV